MASSVFYPKVATQEVVNLEYFTGDQEVTRSFPISGFQKYRGFPRVSYIVTDKRGVIHTFTKPKGSSINITTANVEVTFHPQELVAAVWELRVAPTVQNDVPPLAQVEAGQVVELHVRFVRVAREDPPELEILMPKPKFSYGHLQPEGSEKESKEKLLFYISTMNDKYDEAAEHLKKVTAKIGELKTIEVDLKAALESVEAVREIANRIIEDLE